jgi:hypothetical protein
MVERRSESESLAQVAQTPQHKKAVELLNKGRAELKTSLFKWSPNYIDAAIKFEQAGKIFK